MKQRLLNLAIAIDQLAWVVLTLGNGLPDETISAAVYRMERQGKRVMRLGRSATKYSTRCSLAGARCPRGKSLKQSFRHWSGRHEDD